MRQIKTFKFLFSICFIIFGLAAASAQVNLINLSIWQGKQETKIDAPVKTLTLKKETFTLMFNSLPYSSEALHTTQIAAYTDEASAKLIHAGARLSDIPFLAPGSGAACGVKGYDALTIDTFHNHHHYIFYEDPDSRRAKLEKWHHDTARLSWKIPMIGPLGAQKVISKTDINSFYLIVVSDFDLNGIIDDSEYAVVKVIFE